MIELDLLKAQAALQGLQDELSGVNYELKNKLCTIPRHVLLNKRAGLLKRKSELELEYRINKKELTNENRVAYTEKSSALTEFMKISNEAHRKNCNLLDKILSELIIIRRQMEFNSKK